MKWADFLTVAFLIQILTAGVRLATPLLLSAVGEIFAERSGVLNLGVEGIMLLGGFTGFSFAIITGNLWIGMAASVIVGGLMGLLFAFMTVTLRTNQIATGLALLILSSGMAIYFHRMQFDFSLFPPSVESFQSIAIPVLSEIPFVGEILFNQTIFTYLMFLLIPIATFILYSTPFGLRVNAIGEYPQAADTVGVKVTSVRYICVVIGGMLAALGGACFPLAELGIYTDTMIGGRGFIALALVVFGRWNPLWTLAGGLIFGVVDAIQTRFQFIAAGIPSNFLIMMPYVLTILILLVGRKRNAPAALTVPFIRE